MWERTLAKLPMSGCVIHVLAACSGGTYTVGAYSCPTTDIGFRNTGVGSFQPRSVQCGSLQCERPANVFKLDEILDRREWLTGF